VDSNGYAWALHMKRLLQKNCAIVAKRESKQLTDREYKNLRPPDLDGRCCGRSRAVRAA
jgi:hypothetical protein